MSRPIPAWINDEQVRKRFRRNASNVTNLFEDKQVNATLANRLALGVHNVMVPQWGAEPPFAIVQETAMCRRDFPSQPVADVTWWMLGEIKPARPGHKYCIDCGDWRALDKFTRKKDSKDGLHPYCNTCRAERARVARATEREDKAA